MALPPLMGWALNATVTWTLFATFEGFSRPPFINTYIHTYVHLCVYVHMYVRTEGGN